LYGVILRTIRFGTLEATPKGTAAAVADSPPRRIVSFTTWGIFDYFAMPTNHDAAEVGVAFADLDQ
jgi:hypothetical protein